MWVNPRRPAQSAVPNRGCMVSAASELRGGLVKRVCQNAKAQDFVLRISRFYSGASHRLRRVKMAIALHCGINL